MPRSQTPPRRRNGGGGGGDTYSNRRRRSRSHSPRPSRGRGGRDGGRMTPPPRKSMRADDEQRKQQQRVGNSKGGGRNRDYASPSPPRKNKAAAAGGNSVLRVTAPATAGDRRSIKEMTARQQPKHPVAADSEEENGGRTYPAEGSKTRSDHGAIFVGPEFGRIDPKEQKKIQIDIRRSIPAHRISTSPIRRGLDDPSRIMVSRRVDEGLKTIFDRDEIRLWIPDVPEERVINLVTPGHRHQHDVRDPHGPVAELPRHRDRSRSPLRPPSNSDLRARITDDRHRRPRLTEGGGDWRHGDTHQRPLTVRDRLGPLEEKNRSAFLQKHRPLGSRLGESTSEYSNKKDWDEDRILEREELESRRPTTKPWDINPEFVPRGTNYFEHDNRESFEEDDRFAFFKNDRGRGSFGGRGNSRGGYRGNRDFGGQHYGDYRGRGRGRSSNGGAGWRGGRGVYGGGFRARGSSPEWKHDLFEEQEEPSSTTNE